MFPLSVRSVVLPNFIDSYTFLTNQFEHISIEPNEARVDLPPILVPPCPASVLQVS